MVHIQILDTYHSSILSRGLFQWPPHTDCLSLSGGIARYVSLLSFHVALLSFCGAKIVIFPFLTKKIRLRCIILTVYHPPHTSFDCTLFFSIRWTMGNLGTVVSAYMIIRMFVGMLLAFPYVFACFRAEHRP